MIDVSLEEQASLKSIGIWIPQGQFNIAAHTLLEPPCKLLGGVSWAPDTFGAFSYSWSPITERVSRVGRYCSIARGVKFARVEHPISGLTSSSITYDPLFWEDWSLGAPTIPLPVGGRWGAIDIGNDVWIGENAYVRGGVSIGDGAVIGSDTVVTKDVPPYAVVVGNPGRIVRKRFPEATIERLLTVKWWKYRWVDLKGVRFSEINNALEDLDLLEAIPYTPAPIKLIDHLDVDQSYF